MVQQCLYEWMNHPELLNRETLYKLRTLLAHYPYFQTARLLYLKNLFLLHDIAFGDELRRAALFLADRRILFSLVEGDHYMLKALEKQQVIDETSGVDRTLTLIDAFLSSLPEEPAVSDIITLPVETATDYTTYLMKESAHDSIVPEEAPKMKGQEWIDSFLEKSEEQPLIASVTDEDEEEPEKIEEEKEEESYFTETLAKIYVKQQRYSKALEIITRLNLKYPEKNAYFADQIRFLEKLIINTKSK
ncbi:MAG: tetratricopeptide repeat protein [Bacteroidaceae bacterium]|nr:tetratricopeptide repeat protein [Bacteroidaceae bacterium]